MITQNIVNDLSRKIIGFAIDIHKELGPGLLESIYEKCLYHLLVEDGCVVEREKKIPLNFHGLLLDCDLRYDLLVNDLIIVELKTVEDILSIHEAQLLTLFEIIEETKGHYN
jgi:GxxExxY protein